MAAAPAVGQPAATAYARVLLTHGREELRAADIKASALFAITGAGAGIAAAAAVALSWNPVRLAWPVAVLSWVAIGSVLAGLLMIGMATYPRTGPGVTRVAGQVAYFGDVARCTDVTALREALGRSAATEYTLVTEELLAVSRIAAVKYRFICASQWSLLLGGLAACAAVGVSL